MRAGKLTTCCLLLLLAGCDFVASRHPVGETPLAVEESEWEGVWLHGDGSLTVRVVDSEQGLLEAAWLEEDDDEFVMESVDVFLRRYGGWTFASFAGVEEDQPELLWSRLERDEEMAFLWWPRPAEFKRLVEAGLLPGTIDGDDVLLHRLEPEQLAIITSEEHGVLFDWDEPMTFQRVR